MVFIIQLPTHMCITKASNASSSPPGLITMMEIIKAVGQHDAL